METDLQHTQREGPAGFSVGFDLSIMSEIIVFLLPNTSLLPPSHQYDPASGILFDSELAK